MTEEVFVSYARRDLALAEFLAAGLEGRRVRAWIDVHAIGPGADWQRAIREALERCTAVVAVASRSSLASPYCREEWQQARAAGKPIVLAVVEALPASLPPELGGAVAVDVRRPEWDRWFRLADAVREPIAARPPELTRIRLPIAMSVGVTALVLILALQVACIYELVASARDFSVSADESRAAFNAIVAVELVAALALVLYTANLVRWFVRRRVTYLHLMTMCLSPSVIAGIGVSETSWPNIVFMLEGAIALIAASGYRKDEHSLLPWLPMARVKTDAPASVRIPPDATRRPSSFRLHFDRRDAPVASAVAAALTRAGHTAAGDDRPADCDFLLLSNATPAELTSDVDVSQRVVSVVLSRIRRDPSLGGLQWFDYRRQEPMELEALAAWLAVPGAELREVVWKYKPLSEVSLPAAISGLVGILTGISVLFLSVAAWLLAELAFSGEEQFGSWQQIVFPPLAALVMALTAGGLRHRAITFVHFLGLLAVACALIIASEPGLAAIVAALLGGTLVGIGYVRTWTLGRRLRWQGPETLSAEPSLRAVTRWIVLVIVLSAAVAVPLTRDIWV